MAERLEVGQRVRLRHDPQRRGVVRQWAERADGSFRYQVAIGDPAAARAGRARPGAQGDSSPWYVEADLEPLAAEQPNWLSRDDFLRELLLLKLRYPLTDMLYEFRASRTDFLPYQYLPVLKFLENPDRRILIADEVGLGKTIEACIIYRELEARSSGSLNGVLIVCPSLLRRKWQDELRERYDEHFEMLDSTGLERLVEEYRNPFGRTRFRSIISYETLRRKKHEALLGESRFQPDLIIFDEAHHMRNKGTSTNKIATLIATTADAIVMLSATPLHTGNENLYHLLNMLVPGDIKELSDLQYRIKPNQYINAAIRYLKADKFMEARLQLEEAEKDPYFQQSRAKSKYDDLRENLRKLEKNSTPERRNIVRVQREVHELNTLSDIFSRTRKRDVAKIALRVVETPKVKPTDSELLFYRAILNDAKNDLRRRGVKAINFASVTRERMAASCLQVIRENCINSMTVAAGSSMGEALLVEDSVYDVFADSHGKVKRGDSIELTTPVKWTYSDYTRNLALRVGKVDSKLDRLLSVVSNELGLKVSRNSKSAKILLFATYRGTLDYLNKKLRPIFEERGLRCGMIHGGVKIDDRYRIIDEFREDPKFRLLLSSEVGGEGLDFQFCEVLINYDMPWNPMRVEQRIGRLDRIGQERDAIRIINFYLGETIDTRILKRLHDRINLFKQSIGDLEEILGEVTSELSRRMFETDMSAEEQSKQVELAADRVFHQQKIAKDLEKKADQLLGNQDVINTQMAEQQAGGRIIHAEEVRATVQTYLAHHFPNVRMVEVAGTKQWTLRGDEELSDHIRGYRELCIRRSETVPPVSEGFLRGLTFGGRHTRLITFHSDAARQKSKQSLEFITHHHALAQLACNYWREQYDGYIPALGGLEMEADCEESSDNYYFLFVMEEMGLHERRTLFQLLIGDDGEIRRDDAERVLGKLHNFRRDLHLPVTLGGWERASDFAQQVMDYRHDQRAKEIREQNLREVILRIDRNERHHRAEIERIEARLHEESNLRIIRMLRGQMRNLELRLQEKKAELNQKNTVSVSYELVASGRVRLVPVREHFPAAEIPRPARRGRSLESLLEAKDTQQPVRPTQSEELSTRIAREYTQASRAVVEGNSRDIGKKEVKAKAESSMPQEKYQDESPKTTPPEDPPEPPLSSLPEDRQLQQRRRVFERVLKALRRDPA